MTAKSMPLTFTNCSTTPEITPRGVGKTYLFVTSTCPNCRMAKEFLKDEEYELINAEEQPELAARYGVMQAPTLVIDRDGAVTTYANASNIRKYAAEHKKEVV